MQYRETIEEAEKCIRETNAKTLATLDQYRADVPKAEQAAEDAAERVEDIEADYLSGDGSTSASNYAKAKAEAERAAMLSKGAAKRVARAERAVKNTDSLVAEAMAEIVETAMPGVPVVATFADVREQPEADERPMIVVRQTEPSETNRSEARSANVVVTYYRTPMLRVIDHRAIEDAARKAGAGVSMSAPTSSPDDTTDTLRVSVRGIAAHVPVIAKVDPSRAKTFPNGVATDIVSATFGRGEGVKFWNGIHYSRRAKVAATWGEDVETATDDDGDTLTTMRLAVAIEQPEPLTGTTMAALIEQAMRGTVGQYVPGVGRVIAAEPSEEGLAPKEVDRAVGPKPPNDGPTNAANIGYEARSGHVWALTMVSRAQ